jgi:hypothetical protein
VGSRAVLDAVVKRKIPSPRWESNLRTPIVQPVAQRYTDYTAYNLIKLLRPGGGGREDTNPINLGQNDISCET